MRLFAALLLPREVLDHVAQLAAGVHAEQEQVPEPAAEASHPGQPGRHAASSGRRFGRRRGQDLSLIHI